MIGEARKGGGRAFEFFGKRKKQASKQARIGARLRIELQPEVCVARRVRVVVALQHRGHCTQFVWGLYCEKKKKTGRMKKIK